MTNRMDDLLARLQAAATDEERSWLTVEFLLSTLPPNVQAAAWAAAIPHWFNADILAALLFLPSPTGRGAGGEGASPSPPGAPAWVGGEGLYVALQALPFVEPFAARGGHAIHDVTRAAMLKRLWTDRRDDYLTLSNRAAAYFAQNSDPAWQIEHAYHLLITDPDRGADALWNLGAEWNNTFQYNLVFGLAQAGVEQAQAGRSRGRAAGWAYFRLGQVESRAYNQSQAKTAFQQALAAVGGDRQLEANCIQALGDVHVRLSELPEARARYEEAQPIYRAIGARLGEANCIQALGDLYAAQEEYEQALVTLREAAARYRVLGLKSAEANAINSIANLEDTRGDHAQAIAAYTEAMALYESPMWYRNRAYQYLKLKDAANAAADIEAAAQLQPEHPYLFVRRGALALLQKDYAAAETHYRAAIARYPRLNGAHFGLGQALLGQGRPVEALAAYDEGLAYTYGAGELKEPLAELETWLAEQPDLPGLAEALARLRAAREKARG